MNRSFWPPLPLCPVLWLWWIWPLGPGLPSQDSSIRNTTLPWYISFKALIIHTQRDRSHSYYDPRHRRHFRRSQSHPNLHHDRSSSFKRHTSCSSSNHHSSLCCPLADECSHYTSCHDTSRHSCTLPTLATSPAGITDATPQTGDSLTPTAPTTQHKDLSQGRSGNTQDPQPPINPSTPDCHHPGFPFRLFIGFGQWLWSF